MPARPRPIRLEDLFELKAVGRVAVSPSGQTIVYELKRCDQKENKNFVQLWRVDVPSAASTRNGERISRPRPLTAGGAWSDTRPRFSPDGTRVAFLSTRDKGCCLFVLPLDGGEPRRLTEPDGFAHDFDWSPDSRRIVFTWQAMSEREKLERDGKYDELKKRPQYKHVTRLFHKLDGAGWWNGNYTHVYLVDAEGGRPRQLTRGSYDDQEPRFSPDGRLVSFTSNRVENPDLFPENADLFVVRPSGGPSRKITRKKGSCRGHAWSPDGGQIAFIGNPGGPHDAWKYPTTVWSVASAGGRPRSLTPRIDNECFATTLSDVVTSAFEVPQVVWSADGRRLLFLVSRRGATELCSCSATGGDVRTEIGGETSIHFLHQARPDGPIALCSGDATDPGDVHLAQQRPANDARKPLNGRPAPARAADRSKARWDVQRLTFVNRPLLERIAVVEPEPFTVKSRGAEVHGWVLRPPGFVRGRKYPAILEIHGGPQAQYGHAFFHEMQWLAAQGYVVAYSNPRGSTGNGNQFRRAIHADWGNLDYIDVMKVADWLAARPYVDRRRMGITGGSYGGYMTNWVIGHTDRFAAAVTQRSVWNMVSMYGTSDYGWDLGTEFGGKPWENAAALHRCSPMTFVRNIRTPLLIEHEEEDHRCPIEQAEQLFTALKVLGRTVEMVRFEGESHGLSRTGRPQNRAERLRRIAGWFDRYLK